MTSKKIKTRLVALLTITGVLLAVFGMQLSAMAQVTLPSRSLKISDPRPGQTNVSYMIGFSITGSGYTLGSVRVNFCSNSPLIGLPCTPPPGFDVSSATISSQSGVTDFSIAPGATPNTLILTRTPSMVGPVTVRIELSGVTNPSSAGTYFGRYQTYASTDASGASINQGGVTFSINPPIDIETYVPPYLFLCVAITLPGYLCDNASGNFIDFGELSASQTRTGTSQFLVATNAGQGFVVYITGAPPTSGNNVIPGMVTRGPSQRGTSQFGFNLRDNSNPDVGNDPVGVGSGVVAADYNVPNEFKFVSGQTIVSSNTTTADRKFTSSYIINVNNNQRPGIYNTTLLYTALATF